MLELDTFELGQQAVTQHLDRNARAVRNEKDGAAKHGHGGNGTGCLRRSGAVAKIAVSGETFNTEEGEVS
jgi:hypothetical protein